MISNCGHDEKGKYSGGTAGDQTGKEWAIIDWYSRPWKCVLRHPKTNVRSMIAQMAKAAADNNMVGYDQSQRYTFWEHLKASDYNPAKITVKCEADCSSGVAAIVKAAGYRLEIQELKDVSIYCYTGNLREALKAAEFEVLTDRKYLVSDEYLLEGDILLNDGVHTAINLTRGSKADASGKESPSGESPAEGKTDSNVKAEYAESFDKSIAGTYIVSTDTDPLMLRSGAGDGKTVIAEMPKGAKVQCYGYYTTVKDRNWYYIVYDGKTGFASSRYLKKK